MSASKVITEFLKKRIDAGDFPSAVSLVAEKGEIVLHDALGFAVIEPEMIEARKDTIYDLASLTKILVAGLLAAKLVEDGRLSLSDPLGDYFEVTDEKRAITIRQLLTHTSGLPAWRPFYQLTDDPKRVSNIILATPTTVRSGEVVYSDLNFILLGKIVENVFGEGVERLLTTEIVEPLGLIDTFFNPVSSLRPRIAANERGRGYEVEMTAASSGSPPYTSKHRPSFARSEREVAAASADRVVLTDADRTIWGKVHDGNAWFTGGVSGHAGLFSTAEEVFRIAQQFLPGYTRLLKPATCDLFLTNFTPEKDEHRSFAFQLASTRDSTAGTKMSPQSFGHNGFTGTSLWIDPVKDRIFVLLTNRTHNRALPFANINSVRRRFHDLAIEQLEKR